MRNFNYLIADNLDAAIAEYSEGKTMLKAGGVDVADIQKERITYPNIQPDNLLSIHELPDLNYIKADGDGVRIGALTTLADIGRSELIRDKAQCLHRLAAHAATPQVRERATIGGNICQRPRCWYFRSADFPCLKKGGAVCYSVDGENQYHAIFGNEGPCHIVHPSNVAPALLAMDAVIIYRNKDGEKQVKAREFFQLPVQNLYGENILKAGDIVTEIHIPKLPEQSAALELREKQSFDWPIAMVAVARMGGAWQICLGAVAPVPWLSTDAMAVAGSSEITPELAAKAGEAAAQNAEPMTDNGYKIQLVKVAVKRALLAAAGKEAVA